MKVRCSCTDSASSNSAAERAIAKNRSDAWSTCDFPCCVHKVATGMSRCFGLLLSDISCMVNFILSLSSAAAMSKFRSTVAHVVRSMIRFVRGDPPIDYKAHQTRVLDLFLGGRDYQCRRHMLTEMFNRDWKCCTSIYIHVSFGEDVDLSSLTRDAVQCAASVMCGRCVHTSKAQVDRCPR